MVWMEWCRVLKGLQRGVLKLHPHRTETRGSSSFASTSCRLPMDSIFTLRGLARAAAAAPALGSIGTNDCSGVGCERPKIMHQVLEFGC